MKSFLSFSILLLLLSGFSITLINNNSKRVKKEITKAESDSVATGRYIFRRNCSSCHKMDKPMSGPVLKGSTSRGPWKNRANIYKWIHNPAAFMQTSQYARDLQKKFGGATMACYPLPDSTIDCIIAFINEESKKKANDPTRFDLQPGVKVLKRDKDRIIYKWPDGMDTFYITPDTTIYYDTEYPSEWFDTIR